MKKDHIYVSGPMTGIKDNNVPAFARAAKALRKAGYKVVNPGEYEGPANKLTWEECLWRDLILIGQKCFAVATLPGWEKSRGAKLEIHVAKALSMPVHTVKHWIKK